MAWTQADIDALKTAMAKGVQSVRYVSGEVTYRSLDDMRKLLNDMEAEVNPTANPSRRVGRYDNGLGGGDDFFGRGWWSR